MQYNDKIISIKLSANFLKFYIGDLGNVNDILNISNLVIIKRNINV